ncbi:MAG: DUF1223 domain-containing protein [Pseudomonadota bacterium]
MQGLRAVLCAIGLWAAAGAAHAQGPVVVELFTSQGCSSCPPADRLLGELASRDDIIALALHVDYWDYIGWTDTFADPAYTARQGGYARASGSTIVYTPQMVIGGHAHVVGHQPMAVFDEIMAHADARDPVLVQVSDDDGAYLITVEMQEAAPPAAGMVVQLVGYMPSQEVDIGRGENANNTYEYHNIVQSWQVIGDWDGADVYSTRVTLDGTEPFVVIVQQANFGPVMGAARLN